MPDYTKELWLAHRQVQEKYTHYLLVGAAAAIALVVNQTHNTKMAWPQIPLAMAAVAWAGSFCAGCFQLSNIEIALSGNIAINRLKEKTSSRDEATAARIENLQRQRDRASRRAMLYRKWQFGLLVLGAVLYLGWHVWGMYCRTLEGCL